MTLQVCDIDQAPRRTYKRRNVSAFVDPNDIFLLQELADGKGLSQIGPKLGITAHAVSSRCQRLFQRIGVHNAAHAVAWGFRNHYLR